ncbi:MAG TPA: hypothetical protein VEH47_02210 [Candidatus Acidoferrales bacterium]|nr:hypothetical protein [Candidatus Acidoferrales bacterium]
MSTEKTEIASVSPEAPAPSFPAAAGFALTEDIALSLLKNRDLSSGEVEQICKNNALIKSRKVRLALAAHPGAPRRIVLRLIREFYTFDLMQFSLMPAVPADLKRVAEEQLVARLASITLGERLSLARRSSGLVAAALLLDKEVRVWQAALENPHLTEAAITKALLHPSVSVAFVEAVCRHAKWSLRSEIRLALLRNPHTPLARALEFARRLSPTQLRDVLRTSRLPEKIKDYLRKDLESRGKNC